MKILFNTNPSKEHRKSAHLSFDFAQELYNDGSKSLRTLHLNPLAELTRSSSPKSLSNRASFVAGVMQGQLYIRRTRSFSWELKWFVSDVNERELRWYDSQSKPTDKRQPTVAGLDLTGRDVNTVHSSQVDGHRFAFEITTNSDKEPRRVVLSAPTQHDLELWLTALEGHCEKANSAGKEAAKAAAEKQDNEAAKAVVEKQDKIATAASPETGERRDVSFENGVLPGPDVPTVDVVSNTAENAGASMEKRYSTAMLAASSPEAAKPRDVSFENGVLSTSGPDIPTVDVVSNTAENAGVSMEKRYSTAMLAPAVSLSPELGKPRNVSFEDGVLSSSGPDVPTVDVVSNTAENAGVSMEKRYSTAMLSASLSPRQRTSTTSSVVKVRDSNMTTNPMMGRTTDSLLRTLSSSLTRRSLTNVDLRQDRSQSIEEEDLPKTIKLEPVESLAALAKRAKKQAEAGLPKSLLKQFDRGIDLVLELSSEDSFCGGDLTEREAREILVELALRNPDVASALRAGDGLRIIALGRDLVQANLKQERLTGRLSFALTGRILAFAKSKTAHIKNKNRKLKDDSITEVIISTSVNDDAPTVHSVDVTTSIPASEKTKEAAIVVPATTVTLKRCRFASKIRFRLFEYTLGASVPSDGGPALGFKPKAVEEIEYDLEEYEAFRGGTTKTQVAAETAAPAPLEEEVDEEWNDDWRVPREYFLEHGRVPVTERSACLGRAGHRRLSIDLNRAEMSMVAQSRKKNSRSKASKRIIDGEDPEEVMEWLKGVEAAEIVAPFLYQLRDAARERKGREQRERKLQRARERHQDMVKQQQQPLAK